jgi:hypothetical protein
MSMPRGRRDVRAKGRSVEIPRLRVPICEPFRSAAHYNRLELEPINRVSRAAMYPTPQRASAEVRTSRSHHRQVIRVSTNPWTNSFLVHRGGSCNKQVSGVTGLG